MAHRALGTLGHNLISQPHLPRRKHKHPLASADGFGFIPMMSGARQIEFSFGGEPAPGDGLKSWRESRELAINALARKSGLPIGREAEVWLRGGIRLRGQLRLRDNALLLPDDRANDLRLEVEGVSFSTREIESCVRLG